jgi:N6-adenosine-specific RNA methylase IME4
MLMVNTPPKNWYWDNLLANHYGLLHFDVPWKHETYSEKGQGRCPKYPKMTLEEIYALPVSDLAAKNCALLMWFTSTMVGEVPKIMEHWGFKFSGKGFCWAKQTKQSIRNPIANVSADYNWRMNMGYTTRANTEDCWLGLKGKPKRLNANVRELIVAPQYENSAKPDEVYERAERLYPGPYADVFSRRNRPGWDAFGNEVGLLDDAPRLPRQDPKQVPSKDEKKNLLIY